MGCTQEAIEVFEATRNSAKSLGDQICWYAPGKAANAGGVAVSGVSPGSVETCLLPGSVC
jgi:glutamate dehydrogenase (NADP+)